MPKDPALRNALHCSIASHYDSHSSPALKSQGFLLNEIKRISAEIKTLIEQGTLLKILQQKLATLTTTFHAITKQNNATLLFVHLQPQKTYQTHPLQDNRIPIYTYKALMISASIIKSASLHCLPNAQLHIAYSMNHYSHPHEFYLCARSEPVEEFERFYLSTSSHLRQGFVGQAG